MLWCASESALPCVKSSADRRRAIMGIPVASFCLSAARRRRCVSIVYQMRAKKVSPAAMAFPMVAHAWACFRSISRHSLQPHLPLSHAVELGNKHPSLILAPTVCSIELDHSNFAFRSRQNVLTPHHGASSSSCKNLANRETRKLGSRTSCADCQENRIASGRSVAVICLRISEHHPTSSFARRSIMRMLAMQ